MREKKNKIKDRQDWNFLLSLQFSLQKITCLKLKFLVSEIPRYGYTVKVVNGVNFATLNYLYLTF